VSSLAGLVTLDGRPAPQDLVERMAAAMPRLGADGAGVWCDGPAGLVFLHCATTPEAEQERQPLAPPGGRFVVCLDGRLDNREDLFRLLGSDRSPPREAGDAALALAVFERYAERAPEQLVGDYELAVWDRVEERLFVARSLSHWRSFLWWCDGRTFLFAREPRQIFATRLVERRPNEPLLGEILAARWLSPRETLWSGVWRLQPGGALVVPRGGPPRAWRWHQGPFRELRLRSDEEYAERFNELFNQALRAHLRSSTPVAAQLSGGLDSSSVVCRAAELHRAGLVDRPVQPVSAVFPGQEHDESDWVDLAAAQACLTTDRIQPASYDWDWARGWTAETLHLPIRPTAASMARQAEELGPRGFRVLLGGEGGDDWLTGSVVHWPDLLRQGRLFQLWREGCEWNSDQLVWTRLRRVAANSFAPWTRRLGWRPLVYSHVRLSPAVPDWIRPEWARRIGLAERRFPVDDMPLLDNLAQRAAYQNYIRARSAVNFHSFLCFAGMHRMEVRYPFHDRRLTEFLISVPGGVLRRAGRKKALLRLAMRGTLPEATRQRDTKAIFGDTFVDALTQLVNEEGVQQLACVRNGWVDGKRVWDHFARFRATADAREGLLGPIWFAVAVDIWLKHAVGS